MPGSGQIEGCWSHQETMKPASVAQTSSKRSVQFPPFVRGNHSMKHGAKTIQIEPGSEPDMLVEDASELPLELEKNGVRYRLSRVVDDTAGAPATAADPERVIAGMRAAAGSWSGSDAEELKARMYRARDDGTRPLDRP
jgi:hypothetical protein